MEWPDKIWISQNLFYDIFIYDYTKTPKPRSFLKKILLEKRGVIYSQRIRGYVAPDFTRPLLRSIGAMLHFDADEKTDYYKYIAQDIHSGRWSFNLNTHGNPGSHNEVFIKNQSYTVEELGAFIKHSSGGLPVEHVHAVWCYSAEGGHASFAAKLADHIGLPVTAYKGPVRDFKVPYMRELFQTQSTSLSVSKENGVSLSLAVTHAVGPIASYELQDGKWRHRAMAREFYPQLGSSESDGLSSAFERMFME